MASTRSVNHRPQALNNERGPFVNGSTYPSGLESEALTAWVPSIPGVPNSFSQHTETQGRSTIPEERQVDPSASGRTVIAVKQDGADSIKVDITNYLEDAQTIRQEIASKVANNPRLPLDIYRINSEKHNNSIPLDDDELLIACLCGGTLEFSVESVSGEALSQLPPYAQAPSSMLSTAGSMFKPAPQRVEAASPAGGSNSNFSLYAGSAAQQMADPDQPRPNYKDPITNPGGNAKMTEQHRPQQSSKAEVSGFSVPYYDDNPITVDTPINTTSMVSSLPSPTIPPAGHTNVARNTLFSEPHTMTKAERLQRYGEPSPDAAATELLLNQSSGEGPAPDADGVRAGTISRRMTMDEVLHELYRHGCKNITPDLNISMSGHNPVASGGFGDVYRGRLNDGTEVGLKCVRIDVNFDEEGPKKVRDAAKELYIWSKCDHPNVLKLIGVTRHRNQIAMVSPWMKYGDLPHYLQTHPGVNRYHLCAQIAEGVAYLHRENMVHGDIKGVNILVSEDHIPKIADFGTASRNECTLNFTQTSRSDSMSVRWSAPEVINEGTEKNTPAADVFSLAMTILEVITGKVPFSDTNWTMAIALKLGVGEQPKRPEAHIPTGNERADRLWSLLTECWAMNPDRRPTAMEVRDEMRIIASM